jgi:FtsP/CotA-like multicopper oxidase with cupredoxin domain
VYDPAPGCEPECNPEFSGPPRGHLTGANNLASYAPLIQGFIDTRFAIRIINMGYAEVPWHIHGWHFTVVGKDGSPIDRKSQREEFTVHVGSGETYDLIIQADSREGVGQYEENSTNQAVLNEFAEALGSYPADGDIEDQWFPMHSHNDYTVTNNGFYPGGAVILIHTIPQQNPGVVEPDPAATRKPADATRGTATIGLRN